MRLTIIEALYKNFLKMISRLFNELPKIFFALIVALIVATVSSLVDHVLNRGLFWLDTHNYFIQIILSIFCMTTSAFLVMTFHPTVRGSGIPEMKLFLCHWESDRLRDYLSFRAFLVKLSGLMCALMSGLPIGKEGPFVHIACIVSYLVKFRIIPAIQGFFAKHLPLISMFRLSFMTHGFQKHSLRLVDVYRTLAAACALGVASTFGAPVGGLMFSIEVTSKLFDVDNYWSGFFIATCGALFFRLLISRVFGDTWYFKPYLLASLPHEEYEFTHLCVYLLIGLISGILSSLFIMNYRICFHFTTKINRLLSSLFKRVSDSKRLISWSHPRSSKRRVIVSCVFTAVATLLINILSSTINVGENMPLSQHAQLSLLFDRGDRLLSRFHVPLAAAVAPGNHSSHNGVYQIDLISYANNYATPLLTFCLTKLFLLCPIAICLPVPCGIFFPILTVGACIGRLIGDTVRISSAGCAIVGAAALSGGVTHTVSTAVILTEMTQEVQYLLPCAMAAFVGKMVAEILSRFSIYDTITRVRGMPHVPEVDEEAYTDFKQCCARDILDKDVNIHDLMLFMTSTDDSTVKASTYADLHGVLLRNKSLAKSKKSHNDDVITSVYWLMLPVMRASTGVNGGLELVGYVRHFAAETLFIERLKTFSHCFIDWDAWILSQDELKRYLMQTIVSSSPNPSGQQVFGRWKTFLQTPIIWSELLEEGPCTLRSALSIPEIWEYTYRIQIPQVFVLHGGQLVGGITRRQLAKVIKKLHRTRKQNRQRYTLQF